MKSILITPRNPKEFKFLFGLLNKLNVSSRILTTTEIEDMGMSLLLKPADRSKNVSRESIMRNLRSK